MGSTSAPSRHDQRSARGPATHLTTMTALLAVISALAAAGTAFVPDVLSGTAVMNGSARGTALVVLVLGVPGLLVGMAAARRGSIRGVAVWTGVATYLTYNAVMFCFATPFNQLFPLYVAMLSLAVFLLGPLVVHSRIVGGDLSGSGIPRWIGFYVLVVVVLNSLLWLRGVGEALVADEPTSFLEGSGLTTNPVYVQDLAFWLPAMAWLGVGALRHRRELDVLVAGGLVFWLVEGVGVAVDQWLGHRADPGSDWASMGAVWLFVGTTAVGLIPVWTALRRLPGGAGVEPRSVSAR